MCAFSAFPQSFGSIPQPEPRKYQHEKAESHHHSVTYLNLFIAGTKKLVKDGAIVEFLNKVAFPFFN